MVFHYVEGVLLTSFILQIMQIKSPLPNPNMSRVKQHMVVYLKVKFILLDPTC